MMSNLEQENILLKKQLQNAKEWMQKEVLASQKSINIQDSQTGRNNFYHENLEEIIQENIYSFFPSDLLTHFPSDGIENIISSELIYYHIIQGWHVDGTGVMIWYQKILDAMIEHYITKGFRKYILKNKLSHSPSNIPLEKSFYSIIDRKYSLSLWRLYDALKQIQSWEKLSPYLSYFNDYIRSKSFLEKALLQSAFLLQLEALMHLHAVSEKRHTWTLSSHDTTLARDVCVWNFKNKNCLLYILAASQSVDI